MQINKGGKKVMEQNEHEKINMEVTYEMVEGYKKILFKGKLIYTTIQFAKKRIDELLEEADGYIIDLYNIEQIDSTGFGFLINVGKRLNAIEKDMVILVKDAIIRELFEISKLDQVFSIVENTQESINILKEKSKHSTIKIEEY